MEGSTAVLIGSLKGGWSWYSISRRWGVLIKRVYPAGYAEPVNGRVEISKGMTDE
ncbi:MAG: hypothetical protein H5T33_07870 [Candidatus Methanosuratus sp.]|nr:hypothetical protein [Candidatus Methanosuratincola sp.]